MSLELSDSSHIVIRSGCLVNFVSEVKEKRTVMKVFIKCESFGGVKTVCMCPWLYLCNVTFKKLASVSLPSVINLMFIWRSLRPLNRSSTPVVYWARSCTCICRLYISTTLEVVTWIWIRTLFQVFP